ncbi:MAG: MerR family transcriptional regulator [Pseudomonadota bacterium]|nr:MerR family DNA-binding protein [Nevskiales bacterium]MEC9364837.1 MerR family transcriptional regulator [Pseudomonadota bacterium]
MTSSRRTAPALHTVSALAERTGLSAHAIRLYLRRGLLRASRRSSAGYQLFDDDDAQRLRFIRVAQSLGFTLNEIGEIIDHGRRRESPCPMVRTTIQARLDEARRELDALQAMRKRMQQSVEVWNTLPDAVPTGNDICHLITAIADSWPDLKQVNPLPGVVARRSRTSSMR